MKHRFGLPADGSLIDYQQQDHCIDQKCEISFSQFRIWKIFSLQKTKHHYPLHSYQVQPPALYRHHRHSIYRVVKRKLKKQNQRRVSTSEDLNPTCTLKHG